MHIQALGAHQAVNLFTSVSSIDERELLEIRKLRYACILDGWSSVLSTLIGMEKSPEAIYQEMRDSFQCSHLSDGHADHQIVSRDCMGYVSDNIGSKSNDSRCRMDKVVKDKTGQHDAVELTCKVVEPNDQTHGLCDLVKGVELVEISRDSGAMDFQTSTDTSAQINELDSKPSSDSQCSQLNDINCVHNITENGDQVDIPGTPCNILCQTSEELSICEKSQDPNSLKNKNKTKNVGQMQSTSTKRIRSQRRHVVKRQLFYKPKTDSGNLKADSRQGHTDMVSVEAPRKLDAVEHTHHENQILGDLVGDNNQYEPYKSSWEVHNDLDQTEEMGDSAVQDLFKEMALVMESGWEQTTTPMETPGKIHDAVTSGCKEHTYLLQDDVGMVCLQCGLIGQDIETIFISQVTKHSKKRDLRSDMEEDEDGEIVLPLTLPSGIPAGVKLVPHPYHERSLYPHQKDGFNFLNRNLFGFGQVRMEPGGCILAHAPGTGKSFLTVSFIQSFLAQFPNGKPLIVAPKIMLKPWEREFEQWQVEQIPILNLNECRPDTRFMVTDDHGCGMKGNRGNKLSKLLKDARLKLIRKWYSERSIMLVSYALFAILVSNGLSEEGSQSIDHEIAHGLLDGPEILILDEAHFARNKNTNILRVLMQVRTKRRVLLSGTLFQNNFEELFNLLKLGRHNFMKLYPEYAHRLEAVVTVDENCYPDIHIRNRNKKLKRARGYDKVKLTTAEFEKQIFLEEIGNKLKEFVEGFSSSEVATGVIKEMRHVTAPFVHWYSGQILEKLPGLHEFAVYVNLTEAQMQICSHLICRSFVEERIRVEEISIHPSLLKNEDNLALACPEIDVCSYQSNPDKGVKTAFLFNLIRLCQHSGERILVFVQTLSPLNLVEQMLIAVFGWSKGTNYLLLTGKMKSDERQDAIEEFNKSSSSVTVMLASITACKEGISLVGASRVVIMDVSWNPSVVRQAVSRAFRLGQKRRVYVYRLVAVNTKEEELFQEFLRKDWLSRVLLESFNINDGMLHPESILLPVTQACEDTILQKMLKDDTDKNISHIFQYKTH